LERGLEGGRRTYLTEYDETQLTAKLTDAADNYNCIEEAETVTFMHNLAREKPWSAEVILEAIECPTLAAEIKHNIVHPDPKIVKRIAGKINFRVCNAQDIEEARRKGCDKEVITESFAYGWTKTYYAVDITS
jgi:hypothetical protein